jgi:hypothetical protein
MSEATPARSASEGDPNRRPVSVSRRQRRRNSAGPREFVVGGLIVRLLGRTYRDRSGGRSSYPSEEFV